MGLFAKTIVSSKDFFDPNATQAGERRVLTLNGVEFPFRYCPPGDFLMGAADDEGVERETKQLPLLPSLRLPDTDYAKDERPRHMVILSRGFWLMETGITFGQWNALRGRGPIPKPRFIKFMSRDLWDALIVGIPVALVLSIPALVCLPIWLSGEFFDSQTLSLSLIAMAFGILILVGNISSAVVKPNPECPKTFNVTNEAIRIADYLNKSGAAPTGWRFRLPTEAQWEYACRAGTTTVYWWGNKFDPKKAFCSVDNSPVRKEFISTEGKTSVYLFRANPWGLRDMLGNEQELVADGHSLYSPETAVDPFVPVKSREKLFGIPVTTSADYVLRGGRREASPNQCRCASRLADRDVVGSKRRSGHTVVASVRLALVPIAGFGR